jgi:DNA-binding transcriptional regulator YiaG
MSNVNLKEKEHPPNVLAEYDATKLLKSPFKVILNDSVYQVLDDAGNLTQTVIPEPEGLIKAVALARVLHPHKLSGADIKFLRSALGKKSKDLARGIALTPEHLSRCEHGVHPLSPQSEMLVRIYTYVSTLPFTSKKKEDAEQIAGHISKVFEGLNVRSAHSIEDKLVLYFSLGHRDEDDAGETCAIPNDDELWDQSVQLGHRRTG